MFRMRRNGGALVMLVEIILYSALLSPITTAGLYVFLSGPITLPKHRKGL